MTSEEARLIMKQVLALMGKHHEDPGLYLIPEVFGEFMCHALRIANPKHDVSLTPPLTVTVAAKDGTNDKRLLNCSRPMRRFTSMNMPGNADILIDVIASCQESIAAAGFGDARDYSLVVPILKSAAMHARSVARNEAHAEKDGKPKGFYRYLSWEVLDGVVAVLALNEPNRFNFVTEGMLDESGLSFETLKANALANLASHYERAKVATDYMNGMAEITGTGCAASSFILLPEFLEHEAAKTSGDILHIFSSATDHLVIMPSFNAEGVAEVLAALELGSLPAGDIPPLVYADGSLRKLTANDVLDLVSSLQAKHGQPHRFKL